MMSKTASSLSTRTVSTKASSSGPAALIFLHGLGDTPAGWSSLADTLPTLQPRLGSVRCVFPPAPTIGITINNGMKMPGWFDLYDWPIGVTAKDDRDGLLTAVAQIETEVQKLREEGIERNRIVVGGFSQGGAVALLSAYRPRNSDTAATTTTTTAPEKDNDGAFAACVCLSGWLTLADEVQVSDAAKQTPLFWGHGEYDDKVLFEQQAYGVEKLQQQDIQVEAQHYPMGHASHPQEIARFASFLDQVLFGDNEDDAGNDS